MSGHNKWSSIKHRKAAQDAKRGAVFNKLIRELVVAAREGGGDPSTNASLAGLIDKARGYNMPKETMERAIARGAGKGEADNYERITYEGRGPAGTAMIVFTLTDNRNRTVADVRHIFAKHGGALAENGSVSWMFERKGQLLIKGSGLSEDSLLEACAEAGAEDFKLDGEVAEIFCLPEDMASVRAWFKAHKQYSVESADLAMIPKETVEITAEDGARKLLRLLDALDEHDDVQTVYSNWSMSDELVEKVAAAM
jgi:YebC/PmpR family DNA-binding regulatory protein